MISIMLNHFMFGIRFVPSAIVSYIRWFRWIGKVLQFLEDYCVFNILSNGMDSILLNASPTHQEKWHELIGQYRLTSCASELTNGMKFGSIRYLNHQTTLKTDFISPWTRTTITSCDVMRMKQMHLLLLL